MALAAWVGRERFELGEPAFLKAFFSTVFVKLEDEDWGRRFPVLMREVYAGRLSHEQAPAAAQEIGAVRAGLEAFKPDELVWDSRTEACSHRGATASARTSPLSATTS